MIGVIEGPDTLISEKGPVIFKIARVNCRLSANEETDSNYFG